MIKAVLCIACVACVLIIPGRAIDREAFSFTRYDLKVRVEPEQQRLGVRGKIALRNDSDAPRKSLSLQISSTLNWSSIQFQGEPVEFSSQPYNSDIDHTGALSEAIVSLPRPILPKQTIELDIGYEGTIPRDATRLTRIGVPPETAIHSDWDQIGKTFTGIRGVGYVVWYPVSADAASLSEGNSVFEAVGRLKERQSQTTMKVNICLRDTKRIVVMNDMTPGVPGLSAGGSTDDAGFSCSEHEFASLRNEVPFLAIDSFSKRDDADARIYYLPEHKSGADDFMLAIQETAPVVTQWFGDHRDKTESKAQVVDLLDSDAAPHEAGNTLLLPLTGSDTTLLLSAVQLMTRLEFPSPRAWIFTGLPPYAQASYFEANKGRETAIAYLQGHRSALVESEKQNLKQGSDHAAQNSLINSPDEFYVQAKAMNVWWMIRDVVGDKDLSAALHSYKASDDRDAYYMQKVLEAQSHRDLAWFFNDWVYRDLGLPDFRVASVYPRQLVGGGYMVTVTVENLGGAGAEVPVSLRMAAGTASERLIVPGKSKASVRIRAATMPQEATVNDGSVPESDTTNDSYQIEAPPVTEQ